MRAAFFRFTCALWVFGASAFAQHILKWERFHVYVDLDNDGRVRVQETLEVFLNGKIPVLDRPFARCSALQVIAPKLSRLGNDDAFHPVPGAELREQERMMFWRISADNAPEWQDQRMTFRLEYEVRGLVAPAWDIPIGPGSFLSHENFPHFAERIRETLVAWRQPLGRYRFDHDVLFARFSNEGPSELNYTFQYDTAWKRFVSRELRKRHPALEDAWLPHLVALVGETEILRWQVRFGDPEERIATIEMHPDAAPFTGNFSVEQEVAWTTELYVLSRAELAELEADEPRND